MNVTKRDDVCLDVFFVKGIAILLIVLCHIGEIFFDVNKTLYYIFTTGQMACQLFFISSSFSLCLSYSKSRPSYLNFIGKRFKRIAPPYWGAIIITAFFCLIGPFIRNNTYSSFLESPVKIIINIFLLHGFTAYGNNDVVFGGWFVGTIVVFYLFFPPLYKLYLIIRSRIKKLFFAFGLLCCLQITVAIIFSIFNINCDPLSFAYFSFFNQLSSFIAGFIAYDLYSNNKFKSIKHPVLWFVIMILVAATAYSGGYFIGWEDTFVFSPLFFSISYIFLFAIINRFVKEEKHNRSLLGKIVFTLGNRSYGIYLTHLFVIYLFSRALLNKLFFSMHISSIVCFILLSIITIPLCCVIGILYDKVFDWTRSCKFGRIEHG